MAAQGRDRGKLPGDPGIKEADEEAQAVGRVRDDEGADECVGGPAGSTLYGGDENHVVADAAVCAADKVALIGTIMRIGRGRRTAAGAGRQLREVRHGHGGQNLIVIKMFDLLKSLANVQVKSYHNGECYIGSMVIHGPELREGGAGRHKLLPFPVIRVTRAAGHPSLKLLFYYADLSWRLQGIQE